MDCATLAVPENRAHPNGRTIRFGVAIVHAPSGHPTPDPIVFMAGGPSVGAIQQFAMDYYFADASYVQDRDVILVDTRGEGLAVPYLSDPRLGCPEFDQADHDTFYSSPYPGSNFGPIYDAAIRACHDRLVGSGIDLSAYNAAETAADLEALRKALGVKQWNLWAISADGVAGLTYMRLFPGGIRSAVLDSPQSTTWKGGLDYARGRRALLERAFAGCAANAACAARYPDLRTVFYDLVHQLQAKPVDVRAMVGGKMMTFHVDGAGFFSDASGSVDPYNMFNLFSNIWRSAHGQLQQVYRELNQSPDPPFFAVDPYVAAGKTESYVCHDIINFLTQADYDAAAAEMPEIASDILDPWNDQPTGRAGCAAWDVGRADSAQFQPVSSRIPTLITSGEFDQGVTPNIVRQIPATLSRSFYYEFPAATHLQMGSFNPVGECARAIAAQFLDAPTRRPNSGCITALPQFDYTP